VSFTKFCRTDTLVGIRKFHDVAFIVVDNKKRLFSQHNHVARKRKNIRSAKANNSHLSMIHASISFDLCGGAFHSSLCMFLLFSPILCPWLTLSITDVPSLSVHRAS